MNREVKFRYWDKVRNEFITSDVYFLGDGTVWAGDTNNLPLVEVTDNIERVQYTGLKDKNGVEIFEGDIVQFVDFDNTGGFRGDREYKGIVKYQSGIYEIWKNNDSEYYGSDGAFILNHAWLQDDEFEIIGNIYEHPHLLEVPQ